MGDNPPTFSVIVPTHNRPSALEHCLNALAEQDYPCSKFEVIVINDGGAPLPKQTGAALGQRVRLSLLDQSNRGPSSARNTGARIATGEFLAFTDDDCAPDPGWLSALRTHVERGRKLTVGGRTVNGLVDNPFSAASQILIDYLYHFYHHRSSGKSQLPFFSSNNLALARKAFWDVDGFNQELATAEDRDFCARLIEAGYELRFAPDACVIHFNDLNLGSYLSQHFHYGQGNYHYHRLRVQRGHGTYRLEGLGFYAGMLGYPFSRSSGGQALRLASLLVLSQVGNVSGFFSRAFIRALRR